MSKKRGRPRKISQEIQDTLVRALRLGMYIESAAPLAGIDKETIYRWLKEGAREKKGVFWEFSNAIKKAISEGELYHIQNIDKASKEIWMASAWMLERKFPDRWGRREKLNLDHTGDMKIKVSYFDEEETKEE